MPAVFYPLLLAEMSALCLFLAVLLVRRVCAAPPSFTRHGAVALQLAVLVFTWLFALALYVQDGLFEAAALALAALLATALIGVRLHVASEIEARSPEEAVKRELLAHNDVATAFTVVLSLGPCVGMALTARDSRVFNGFVLLCATHSWPLYVC